MKINKKIFLILFLFSLVQINAQSIGIDKVGTTSFQFLKVIPEARISAMGDAGVTISDNSDAVFWNPANLVNVNSLSSSVSYLDWFMDVKQYSISAAYNLGGFGTLGLSVMVNDIGEIEVTRVSSIYKDKDGNFNPGLTGEVIEPSSHLIGLTYAKNLTDKFSFGITVKYVNENLDVKSKSAIVFDGGILYNTGYKSLRIGAFLRNFGPEIQYYDRSYPLPQIFAIGLSGYLIDDDNALLYDGINNNRLLLSVSLSQPRDYSQQYQIGLEYSFYNLLYLRTGYKINYDEESYSLGVGLNYSSYSFDYSYNDFGEYLGDVHRFTIRFNTF